MCCRLTVIPITHRMPGWDIEEEENDEMNVTAGRTGKELYSIVVHYAGLKMSHAIPHHVKRDANGKVVMSSYKKTEAMSEEGTPQSVKEEKVVKWATKKDTLDGMNPDTKQACNAFKLFLTKSTVGLWFHDANTDQCSMFGGAHYHVLLRSEKTASGSWKYLHDVTSFRTMKTKVKATSKGYVRVQAVTSPVGITCHFNTAPRKFLGCNTKEIFKLYLEATKTHQPLLSFNDCVEAADPEEVEADAVDRKYSSWDEDEPPSKKGSWDDDEDKTTFVVEKKLEGVMAIKETPGDRTTRLLKLLMNRYRANNMSEMFARIGKLPADMDVQYKALWYRLASRPSTSKLMATTLEYLKCESQGLKFFDMVKCFAAQPFDNTNYESVRDSYEFFITWAQKQGWDVIKLINDVVDVLDKKREKVNTIALIGASNSGKTVMFAQPLVKICRFVGQVGNRGNASEFIWQECVNTRLISMEECCMAPEFYEDLKLLFGGEVMRVAVKHQSYATLERTPVILTGNKDPWSFDYTGKIPMQNRMCYYSTREDTDLKEIKALHPGMWWYLMQQYDMNREGLIPIEQLEPYPLMDECEEVNPDDPLV